MTETYATAARELDVMTTDEVAARLRVSRRSVQRLIADGRLPHCKIGSLVRVTETQLQRFLEGEAS